MTRLESLIKYTVYLINARVLKSKKSIKKVQTSFYTSFFKFFYFIKLIYYISQ